jgi:peptidoglycan-N-acetylglucosamine deacetylase
MMRWSRWSRHGPEAEVEDNRHAWPEDHLAALSLSFDDARRSQVDVGLELIDQLGVRVTFYVLPNGVDKDVAGWRDAVSAGHEIGNHTARHPCSANFVWTRRHAIEDLDLSDMAAEIADADAWIARTLGVEPRTFAYPCGHTFVGRGRDTQSFVPLVADRFVAGRTFNDEAANSPIHCDLAQVHALGSDGLVFEQLRPILESTLEAGAWLVLGGHEIGHQGGTGTTLSATLASIVEWCRVHQVWMSTVAEAAERVQALQQSEQTRSM